MYTTNNLFHLFCKRLEVTSILPNIYVIQKTFNDGYFKNMN